ncbi:CaiB/BaiF CoA transferase family protein [Aliagarivorans taiwanensis]|uniref:CaiB/BaiF CoA transferase family protein n=1 Tax=Aliagarivorans taiwanensis TaxID=561966 RepID=UPI0003FF1055|nr:CaiB/BaiF CoA-transferase family protein [Aliagarivorans taiwanensis]
MSLPLSGIKILDFSQFLSAPSATLRLADLGAEVLKVEHHQKGDLSRSIYASQIDIAGSSAFYQAINRGKQSLSANLKDADDLALVKQLIRQADVVVSNFRPGVMQRLGLDFESIQAINPNAIYAEISGYGATGPWADKPGQDLLVQALSGALWMTGADSEGPVPMGVAVADILAGAQLAQGILAALLCDETKLVQVSMLESMLDFQFEPLTLFYQDGEELSRGEVNPAHPLVAAPYGLYRTTNGYLALAMGAISTLAELLDSDPLRVYQDRGEWFAKRDEIKQVLADLLSTNTTEHWLAILEPADIWCANVLDWQQLLEHDGFKVLDMVQTVVTGQGERYQTTRCPIRLDGQLITSAQGAPTLGEHNALTKAKLQEA